MIFYLAKLIESKHQIVVSYAHFSQRKYIFFIFFSPNVCSFVMWYHYMKTNWTKYFWRKYWQQQLTHSSNLNQVHSLFMFLYESLTETFKSCKSKDKSSYKHQWPDFFVFCQQVICWNQLILLHCISGVQNPSQF